MPSDQIVEEVRELRDLLEVRKREPGDIGITWKEASLVIKLCRAYLAAQGAEDERPAPDLPQAIKDELFKQACLCADTEAAAQKQPCACRTAMLLEQIEQWGKSLAEPVAIDVEAIKREAVREFAAAMIAEYTANMNECLSASILPNGYSANKLRREAHDWNERIVAVKNLAAARGVNLNEKP